MEELVAFLAGNLEAGETEPFSRDNGLLTHAADNNFYEFHYVTSPALLALPCRKARFVGFPDPCRLSVGELAPGQLP